MSKDWKRLQYVRKLEQELELRKRAETYANDNGLISGSAPSVSNTEIRVDDKDTMTNLYNKLSSEINELVEMMDDESCNISMIKNKVKTIYELITKYDAKLKTGW